MKRLIAFALLLNAALLGVIAWQLVTDNHNTDRQAYAADKDEILKHMSIVELPIDDKGGKAKTIRFSGVNVQVVNGTGTGVSIMVGDTTQVNVSGRTVAITPRDGFDDGVYGTAYRVVVPSGAVQDLSGNAYAGVAYVFMVRDEAAPVLESLSPVDGAEDVALGATFTLTFNEQVQAGSVGSPVIVFTPASAGAALSVNVVTNTSLVTFSSASPYTMTVNLSTSLLTSAQQAQGYTVTMASGVVTDLAGNTFAGIGSGEWGVTVEDTVAPAVVSRLPADGATGVANNPRIVLIFNEPVVAGSGLVTLWNAQQEYTVNITGPEVLVSGTHVIIERAAGLDPGTSGRTYQVHIPTGVIVDASSNANTFAGYAGNDYSFTISNTQAPVITAVSPGYGQTGVAVSTPIVITFNEDMAAGTGFIVLTPLTSGRAVEINVSDPSQVDVTGPTCTITPSNDLDSGVSGQTYRVEMEERVLVDVNGNSFFGLYVAMYEFTVVDAEIPVARAR